MNTPFKGFPEDAERIVYVRPIAVADLAAELPQEAQAEMREQVGEAEVIYSVHAPNGRRLALVADRNLAFHLAKAHDFAPVSVH
ncbi:DUF1150 family protein [Pseudogemmobacter sonorensis]|uniref:DUF1150 family protein n=1 Tax=Pseudogemmobacter sonorensis TaxID=2989681 RepID=UPI00367E8BEB